MTDVSLKLEFEQWIKNFRNDGISDWRNVKEKCRRIVSMLFFFVSVAVMHIFFTFVRRARCTRNWKRRKNVCRGLCLYEVAATSSSLQMNTL